jgi:hypothetical protein
MIVWGGSSLGYWGNGARYNPIANTWAPLSTTGAPAERAMHTAVWAGTQMVIYGGVNSASPSGVGAGACYLPSEDKWTPMSYVGGPPQRTAATAVWDGTELLVWGGNHVGILLKDTYAYTPARSMYLYLKP